MNIKITPSKLCGKADAVSSKSYAHRAVIAAALSEGETDIFLNCFSEDIEATVECIKALGAKAEKNEKKGCLRIYPIKNPPQHCSLNAAESGSTARFMLPVAAALCEEVELFGRGRLPQRPMTPLLREMARGGAAANSENIPLKTEGIFRGGEFEIEGNISSQYITGLLFALSVCDKKSRINLLSPLESKGYIDITLDVLEKFGADIKADESGFTVYPSKLVSPGEYNVEGDWSNSAFFMVANALGSNVEISGLNEESRQGDRKICDIINLFSEDGDHEIDASDIPDLVPVLSVLALKNNGITRIFNAERLRLKESDRIMAVCSSLSALGGDLKETADGIIIRGGKALKGGAASGFCDHRIIMSLAIASTVAEGECIIEGAEGVKKSYPDFFEDFARLGGKINVT